MPAYFPVRVDCRILLGMFCFLLLTGCGGSSGKSSSPAAPADFTIALNTSSVTMQPGTSASVSVSVTAQNGFAGAVNVSISGLPNGVSAKPASLSLMAGTPQSFTLSATATAAAGNATLSITGTSGMLVHSQNLALSISVPTPPDFALTVQPSTLSLTAGGSGQSVSVTASASNGFSGTVNVGLSGLPAGVTASPAMLSLQPGVSQTTTITAAATAAVATTTLTFTGTSGSLMHSQTVSLTVAASAPPPASGIDVSTYQYDNARDGLNSHETSLTLTNVQSPTFGKLGLYPTDGKVDGQPLYLSNVTIGGAKHNVLYVVSEHDSVYAFDADTGSVLWQKSVLGPGETTSDDQGCGQISPEIGITDTPVIDRSQGTNGTIFFVAMSKDASGNYHQRLHAFDITTGSEVQNGPTEIAATYPGTGAFSTSGKQVFDPVKYAERVGLLLMNGSIFLGWTSHCDSDPYTGWLMMYDENTLKQTSVLNLTPNSDPSEPHFQAGEGSIWQGGTALAGDAQGNIYFLDANGSFDATLDANGSPAQHDYGNAFIKVSLSQGQLTPSDYFVSYNTAMQSRSDTDLGSGGPVLLPDMTDAGGKTRHLAVGAGKDGNIYVVDRDNMGKYNVGGTDNHNIYQELEGVLSGVFGKAAYFNNTIYYGGVGDVLKAFSIQQAMLAGSPSSKTAAQFASPGTTPTVTSNGVQNGIVWALERGEGGLAVLHAYDAANLAHELYNSNQASGGRDTFGNGNKFVTPVVANGKVFIGTQTGVAVFGLLQ